VHTQRRASWLIDILLENNLALSEQLYKLRTETKEAFDEAKRLEARQKVVEREQKEVYSVRQILL
jgi:ESCRT-I complex subunit VPS37